MDRLTTDYNLKFTYYDDGKQIFQSHEIYLEIDDKSKYSENLPELDITDICGYGADKKEALDEFKSKVKSFADAINKISDIIQLISEDDFV